MASLITLSLLICVSLIAASSSSSSSSPYLSPIFPKSYNSMSKTFKIFTYIPLKPISFPSPPEALFYKSLLDSPYFTHNPDDAHFFFIPFSHDLSTRSLTRLIRTLRTDLPYWNRTLGADHFFLSSPGLGSASDRNVVELKKNAVQVSGNWPLPPGRFIPHKDIALPPVYASSEFSSSRIPALATERVRVLGFVGYGWVRDRGLVRELIEDPEFLTESEPPSGRWSYGEKMAKSDFCLFEYGAGGGSVLGIGEALRNGCVPAVISDRPIQELPLMDVLRWQDMAVFVNGGGGGIEGVKRILRRVDEEGLEKMKRLGAAAAQHFVWNSPPQPLDAFNTVVYQLWMRRHAVRYVERKDWAHS